MTAQPVRAAEMRDPAVLALYALHLTPNETAELLAGRPVRRPVWPPRRCQGVVVGLCVDGRGVIGEALLTRAESAPQAFVVGLWFMNGTPPEHRVLWHFGPVTDYAHALPCVRGRGMSSTMPAAPLGTLTPARGDLSEW